MKNTNNVIAAAAQVTIDSIQPNPHQPRKNFDPVALEELAASIEAIGIVQPIVIDNNVPNGENPTF